MTNALRKRKDINSLEDALRAMPQLEIETVHHFAHGTYTREVFLPKGTILTGKVHRHSCINIVSQGKILVITDEGEYEIEAPHVFVSGPGVKKAGAVLEDTIWINVHPWSGAPDLDIIEKSLILPENRICHG